jgi:hypothetical protein
MHMATTTPVASKAEKPDRAKKMEALRELYADAPEIAKAALGKMIDDLTSVEAPSQLQKAGRIGLRQGKVSELLIIAPLAKGGAKRLRGLLQLVGPGLFQGTDMVGTVHDMRFVFLDNDTKLLFATAFDGDWDPYIGDFATKIPDALDLLFSSCEDWPGIRDPKIKDWIVKFQIPADGWYVANPNLTVVETRRLERLGKAVDEFLDKVQN